MSRRRKKPSAKPSPAAAPSFALPKEDQPTKTPACPNKLFLATAVLLQTGWLTLLLVLAISG